MAALERWLGEVVPAGSRPVMVALNAPFDWMFVADAFWRHLGRNPFGHSALDIKALYLGRHLDEVGPLGRDVARPHARALPGRLCPHTHTALDDAREQAVLCRRILDRDRGSGGR